MRNYIGKAINANYLGNITYVGQLCFQEEYYEYKADSVNGKLNLGKIYYRDIRNVAYANILGLVPNSLVVELKDGRKFKYVVAGRRNIRNFMVKQIEKYKR